MEDTRKPEGGEASGISKKMDDLGKTSFKINLPSELVELQFCLAGSSIKPLVIQADSEGVVNLEHLDCGVYDVRVYATNTEPALLLHSFKVEKSKDSLNVKFVDIPATTHDIAFNQDSAGFANADVEGQFYDKKGVQYQIKGQSSSSGSYNILLPEGHLENLQAKKDKLTVQKRGKLFVPPSKTSAISFGGPLAFKKATSVTVELNPSTFSNIVKTDHVSGDAGIVVLGDISGSMCEGAKMSILKRSFLEIVEKCREKKCNVALAAWNSWVDWCQSVWIENSNKNKNIKDWVDSLQPWGGNDMRYAIEECMRKFPTASDVYVMCDGDISPFTADGGITDDSVIHDVRKPSARENESSSTNYMNTNWPTFRKRFPKTTFHFVALGRYSQAEDMQLMANAGDGTFWESN